MGGNDGNWKDMGGKDGRVLKNEREEEGSGTYRAFATISRKHHYQYDSISGNIGHQPHCTCAMMCFSL